MVYSLFILQIMLATINIFLHISLLHVWGFLSLRHIYIGIKLQGEGSKFLWFSLISPKCSTKCCTNWNSHEQWMGETVSVFSTGQHTLIFVNQLVCNGITLFYFAVLFYFPDDREGRGFFKRYVGQSDFFLWKLSIHIYCPLQGNEELYSLIDLWSSLYILDSSLFLLNVFLQMAFPRLLLNYSCCL